jgi:ParB-like chromosome segregation protein Spo0J
MKNDDRKIHPAAALFPLLEGEAFDKFVEDMRVNGQTEPIVYEGEKVILDGRNRLRACEKLGIAPRMEPLPEGQDPLAFIISKNLHRRHLSESQRAMIGAQLADMRQGERTDLEPSANRQKVSQADAAKLVNASPRSLARAVKVQKKGAPVLKEAVQHGDLSISAAATIADLAPEQQAKAVNAATIPTAYRGLVPELAQLAAQIKLSKAANDGSQLFPSRNRKRSLRKRNLSTTG